MYHQKPLLGRQINWAHPLAKGLLVCWVFNEGTGTRAFDLSHNGLNGVFGSGTSWKISPYGSCLYFDGIVGWVDPYYSWVADTGKLSIVALARFEEAVGNNEQVCAADSHVVAHRVFQFRRTTTGVMQLITFVGGVAKTVSGGTTLTTNEYWHLAAVTNGVDNRVYVNGVSDATPVTSGYLDSDPAVLTIGGRYQQAPWPIAPGNFVEGLQGRIISINIYTRDLTAQEVLWLYREPYAMFEQPIFKWMTVAAPAGVAPTGALYGPLVGPLGGPI